MFGDNVEDQLGHLRYAVLYLVSGFGALAAQVAFDPSFGQPMIGASGAVSGVLGAYIVMFPRAHVLTLVPLGWIFFTVVLPAFSFLGVWFGIQLLQALVAPQGSGGVAWWAHAGGFAVGAVLALIIRPRRRQRMAVVYRSPRD